MKKKLFLSHSQLSNFKRCQRLWYIDKVERLRPTFTGSALIFGSALDAATESILLEMMGKGEKEPRNPRQVFLDTLNKFQVNGKDKTLPKDLLSVKFFASNINESFLRDIDLSQDFKDLGVEIPEYHHKKKSDQTMFISEYLEYCKQQRKFKTPLTDDEQILFNTLAYRTMTNSGLLFIDELEEWIAENVAEVHLVQKKIDIADSDGNRFIGYLDFVVTLKSGKKVLIDLKTSSDVGLYYPEDCASNSPQLGVYSQETDVKDVAYLVIDKNVKVRDPRVRLYFIEGVITEDFLDEVFTEIEDCVDLIYEKIEYGKEAFEKNKESCRDFGGCWAADYCWKGNKDNLEKV